MHVMMSLFLAHHLISASLIYLFISERKYSMDIDEKLINRTVDLISNDIGDNMLQQTYHAVYNTCIAQELNVNEFLRFTTRNDLRNRFIR